MYVAKYWARACSPSSPQTLLSSLVQYGHSQTSLSEAQTMADQRLHEILKKLAKGEKSDLQKSLLSYQEVDPLREEFLEERDVGEVHLAWTRNSYGALVLNTDRIMFVDIDFDEPHLLARLKDWPSRIAGEIWQRLRGKNPLQEAQRLWNSQFSLANETPRSPAELFALQRLIDYCQVHPKFGGRLYRTKVGLRLLVTTDLYEPDSEDAQTIMKELGSDQLYTKLCRIQKSFRARLSPKPWRCGFKRHHFRFPYSEEDARAFSDWLAVYEYKQQAFQTCAFLCHIGEKRVHHDIQLCVDIHDQACRAHEHRTLA